MSFTLNSFQRDFTNMRSQTPSTDTQYKSFNNRPNTLEDTHNKFNLQKFRSSISDKISPLGRTTNDYERRRMNESQISDGRSSTQGMKKNREAVVSFMGDVDRRQPYKQKNQSIPTFDTLERNIQGLSSSRTRDDSFFQSSKLRSPIQPFQATKQQFTYSPQKLSGIKTKIGGIGSVQSTSNLFQEQRKSDYSAYPSSQTKMNTPSAKNDFKSLIQKSYSGFLSDKDTKIQQQYPTSANYTGAIKYNSTSSNFNPSSINYNVQSTNYNPSTSLSSTTYNPLTTNYGVKQKSLSDVVPINHLIDMRNKLESANITQTQLSSNYMSELVKLASVITSTVKKIR